MTDPAALHLAVGGTLLPTGSLRLATETPVAELAGYAEGLFQVQDFASAVPARLIGARPGMRVLDLCAAPGGKTAQLAAAGAEVVAVERSAARAERLKANLARLKLSAEIVISDAGAFTRDGFDAVLLDAPCSATGTIRRHPEIAWTKTLADIIALANQQRRLLAQAAKLVRVGGLLVYATCSLEPEEGERQIAAFLGSRPDSNGASPDDVEGKARPQPAGTGFGIEPVDPAEFGLSPAMVSATGLLRILPGHLAAFGGTDGFFAARLRRRA